MLKRPIDSFVDYFLDIKPYHTKILEIVEQYKFNEDLSVSIKENIFFTEEWANQPLCSGVGFGFDFDDDCGYSALSCCDLFDCVGGYGLIYDNSDLLVSRPITAINSAGTPPDNAIVIDGDYRYDSFFQIAETVGDHTLKIKGNILSAISPHFLFVIAPKNVYLTLEATSNGFYVSGNVAAQFTNVSEFVVMKSGFNDGGYAVVEAKYNSIEDRTFINVVRQDGEVIDSNSLGSIVIDSETKNNGPYQKVDAFFDGTFTNILLHDNTKLKLTNESRHGAIVLRTGFLPNRLVWVDGDYGAGSTYQNIESKIIDVRYDVSENKTLIFLDNTIETAIDQFAETGIPTGLNYNINLRGYYFGAGFDGYQECSTPKEWHLYAGFSEYLQIEEIFYQDTAPEDLGEFFILTHEYPAPGV